MISEEILDQITQKYLHSSEFNGMPARELVQIFGRNETAECLRHLIESGCASAYFGDIHPNPTIKALPPEDTETQLQKLNSALLDNSYIYPERSHLELKVDHDAYRGRPYELELALGAAQLEYRSFDLSILEVYQNDPRYVYRNDDVSGWISISDAHDKNGHVKESDQILLQSFGFSLDDEQYLFVATFIRYLSKLSPEHQQIWSARQCSKKTYLHPAYFRSAIMGNWAHGYSLYQAVLRDMRIVNELAIKIGRPPFFKKLYDGDQRPREFGYLLRPTLKEYHHFIHLLDKMMSDNINKQFFGHDLEFEVEEERSDGKTIVREKGTLSLLNEWMRTTFQPSDPDDVDKMMRVLKDIRAERQRPAHAIKPNEYNPQFTFKQRELMTELHKSLLMLIHALSQHPLSDDFDFEMFLADFAVWPF